ncbi:MAG: hypothetical protein AAFW69_11135, partial [Pseudomonadota bacterium]
MEFRIARLSVAFFLLCAPVASAEQIDLSAIPFLGAAEREAVAEHYRAPDPTRRDALAISENGFFGYRS